MESIKELRKVCAKDIKESFIDRLWRIPSIYATKVCLILGLKPNFITSFSFLVGLYGGYLYITQQFIVGTLVFMFYFLLDAVDGEVARYRKISSFFGIWLDIVVGHLLYPYFFFTLGIGVFLHTGAVHYLILGSIAAMAKLIQRSGLEEPYSSKNKTASQDKNLTYFLKIKAVLHEFTRAPVLHLMFLLFALARQEEAFLWISAIYLLLFALGKIILQGRRIYAYSKKELRNL